MLHTSSLSLFVSHTVWFRDSWTVIKDRAKIEWDNTGSTNVILLSCRNSAAISVVFKDLTWLKWSSNNSWTFLKCKNFWFTLMIMKCGNIQPRGDHIYTSFSRWVKSQFCKYSFSCQEQCLSGGKAKLDLRYHSYCHIYFESMIFLHKCMCHCSKIS